MPTTRSASRGLPLAKCQQACVHVPKGGSGTAAKVVIQIFSTGTCASNGCRSPRSQAECFLSVSTHFDHDIVLPDSVSDDVNFSIDVLSNDSIASGRFLRTTRAQCTQQTAFLMCGMFATGWSQTLV